MNWAFIVIRDNKVEQIKIFNEFWSGCKYADDFIRNIDPNIVFLPAYNRGENYKGENFSVGLYAG
jgi:hypothetical protein